jgi:hypothetical protein
MDTIKLLFEFHKSTLLANWGFSVIMSFALSFGFPGNTPMAWLPYMSATFGPLASLFLKEYASQNEYYFYYNRGISKTKLIAANTLLNIILSVFLGLLYYHVRLA